MPINAVTLTGQIYPAGPKGDIGPQGKQGIQGVPGPANSLTIGNVEKGTSPSATITGEAPNQKLNLVLPTGETEEIELIKKEQENQKAEINEKIDNLKEKNKQLMGKEKVNYYPFQSVDFESGRIVDGVLNVSDTFKITDKVLVRPGDILYFYYSNIDVLELVEYDSNDNYIKQTRKTNSSNLTLSDKTYKCCLSFRNTDSNFKIDEIINSSCNIINSLYDSKFINDTINFKDNTISPFSLKNVEKQTQKNVLMFAKWYVNTRLYQDKYIKIGGFNSTDLIAVKSGDELTLKRAMTTNEKLSTYNSNGEYIREFQYLKTIYTVPDGVSYIKVTLKAEDANDDFIMADTEDNFIKIPWLQINEDQIIKNPEPIESSKSGIAFGDSLWANSKGNFNYSNTPYNQSTEECFGYDDNLASVNINIDNRAVSGHTIVNGLPRIKALTQSDVSDKDFIIISYGRNDFRTGLALGILQNTETTFDETTYIGCLQSAIEYLLKLKNELKIIIWTPTQSNANGYGIYNVNSDNKKLIDYVNACKEVAQLYSCEVVDMYSKCGINMINLQKFTFEGVHLTNEGYAYTANYYVSKMKSIFNI